MRNHRPRAVSANSPIDRLRLAIDCMPVATRQAMLEGLQVNERIIVGAYVDGQGGVCPMLAAHRQGGRTDLLSFAKSWDRFARAGKQSREATARELRILIRLLQDSVEEDAGIGFDTAIAEHRALIVAGRRQEAARRGERSGRSDDRGLLSEEGDPSGFIHARRLPVPAWGRRRKAERRAAERVLAQA
jgi:hypothetical protein